MIKNSRKYYYKTVTPKRGRVRLREVPTEKRWLAKFRCFAEVVAYSMFSHMDDRLCIEWVILLSPCYYERVGNLFW